MIIATVEHLPDRKVEQVYGLVRGMSIRSRHIGRDLMAVMRNVTGGEIVEYTKMMAEAREEAVDRMEVEARALGANAIVGVRFQTSTVMRGAAELLCYGTAVRVADGPA